MKTTGYALREAIKRQELRRETAAQQFNGSLHAFEDEKGKDSPTKVMAAFLAAESAVAQLQTSQMRYNLAVMVDIGGKPMSLAEAIKTIGGLGRGEKMWRSAAAPKKDRYGSDPSLERDPTRVFAQRQITVNEAVKLASESAKKVGALRAAIAVGNAREVELEGLEAALFE